MHVKRAVSCVSIVKDKRGLRVKHESEISDLWGLVVRAAMGYFCGVMRTGIQIRKGGD